MSTGLYTHKAECVRAEGRTHHTQASYVQWKQAAHLNVLWRSPSRSLTRFLSHDEYIIRHNLFLEAMKYTVCSESSREMQSGTFTLFCKKSLRTFLHIGSATYEQQGVHAYKYTFLFFCWKVIHTKRCLVVRNMTTHLYVSLWGRVHQTSCHTVTLSNLGNVEYILIKLNHSEKSELSIERK